MKKKLLNIALVIVLLACLVLSATAKGLTWFCFFIPMYAAAVGLIKLNTDWIEKY